MGQMDLPPGFSEGWLSFDNLVTPTLMSNDGAWNPKQAATWFGFREV